jgi:rRNA maturation endonuclease Nob1
MKKIIWSEIDGYIKKNKQIIDSEVKEIKKINKELNEIDEILYLFIKRKVLTYLENKMTQTEIFKSHTQKFIERSIIAIYLLRSDNPPLQAKIRKVAGFTANVQVKEIREYLGIPLPPKEYNGLVDDSINQIRQCIKCRKLLNYNKFSIRKNGNLRCDCNEFRTI